MRGAAGGEPRRISFPLGREEAALLSAGDRVRISGVIYAARDAAHKRLAELLDAGAPLPFPVEDSCIYYTGPSPAPPGMVSGSAGPTTGGRMDLWTPRLLRLGLRGMIGKGDRAEEVIAAIRETGALYFAATGGAGALLALRITEAEVVAFGDLGTEAIRRLRVEDFPATVAIDGRGGNLYKEGPEAWRQSRKNRHRPSCNDREGMVW